MTGKPVRRVNLAKAAIPPRQPREAAIVIEVAVAEHHDLDRRRVEAEPLEVGCHPVRGYPGVEQHGVRGRAAAGGD
jgi:hypothetical protein